MDSNSQATLPAYSLPEKEISLSLVLGSGGARGMAHVGVLEVFEHAHIPIDLIVGCSAGSLIGAMYADTPDAARLQSILTHMKKRDFFDIQFLPSRYGLVQGRNIKKLLEETLKVKQFHQLRIPTLVVASDLHYGKLVCLGGGPIIPAVHASCAVPFYFNPVELYGYTLVDGGVVDPVPVQVARQHGSKVVVAVDVTEHLSEEIPNTMFGVAKRSLEIKMIEQAKSCVTDADIVIRPDVGQVGTFDDRFNYQTYEAGRAAAKEALPKIMEALRRDEDCA